MCANVVAEPQGSQFRLQGVEDTLPDFTGTQDWTLVSCDFETRANDCVIVLMFAGNRRKSKRKVWFDDLFVPNVWVRRSSKPVYKVDPAEQKAEMSPLYLWAIYRTYGALYLWRYLGRNVDRPEILVCSRGKRFSLADCGHG